MIRRVDSDIGVVVTAVVVTAVVVSAVVVSAVAAGGFWPSRSRETPSTGGEEIFDCDVSSEGGLAHSEISRASALSDVKSSDRSLSAEKGLEDSNGSRLRLGVDWVTIAVGADMVVPG